MSAREEASSRALNGWQRLWVVFAGVTGIVAIALWWIAWPRVDEATVTRLAECSKQLAPNARVAEIEADFELFRSCNGWWAYTLHKTPEAYISDIERQRRDVTIGIAAAWAVLVGLVYALGWAVAWVRRGFAGTSPS